MTVSQCLRRAGLSPRSSPVDAIRCVVVAAAAVVLIAVAVTLSKRQGASPPVSVLVASVMPSPDPGAPGRHSASKFQPTERRDNAEQRDVAADEDDESMPGLLLSLTNGTHTVQRPARSVVFKTGADSRIDDVTSAIWTGTLLVRFPGRHQFHAELNGHVRVTIDGQSVFDATAERSFQSGDGVELKPGEHAIEVVLTSPGSLAATVDQSESAAPMFLKLFWSSAEFTFEPLPPDVLFRSDEQTDVDAAARGRIHADTLRCAACHESLSELPARPAPDLTHVAAGLTRAQIVSQLTAHREADERGAMPSFELTSEQADAIAASLFDSARPLEKPLDDWKSASSEDIKAGHTLRLSVGCIACHAESGPDTDDVAEESGTLHGPAMPSIARRRSAAWIDQWLRDPAVLNSDHQMPVFGLSHNERHQIVASIASLRETGAADGERTEAANVAESDVRTVETGRTLIQSLRCAACHRIPGFNRPSDEIALTWPISDLTGPKSCLTGVAETGVESGTVAAQTGAVSTQPRFRLTDRARTDLQHWLASLNGPIRPPDASPGSQRTVAASELLLNRNGCLSCHDRGTHRGLSAIAGRIEGQYPELRGQSQALIPPSLTAVGDKLRDEVLRECVAGRQSTRRLPWLAVRMPRFRLSDDEQAAIVSLLIHEDRIPDAADAMRRELFEHFDPANPQPASQHDLTRGNELAGAGGFNCTSCHSAGGFEPRNVAMGTRGSDLMLMGQRLRPRFFLRWMKNPIQVMPGIEMPAIRRPAPSKDAETLPQQFATLWKALADPVFAPPTVTSRYERIVSASKGRPAVIRDVFREEDRPQSPQSERDADGEKSSRPRSVPRAFAVGFDNGHSLLIDLDTFSIVRWTTGEFARLRTEGKSWFHDMAGKDQLPPTHVDSPFCTLLLADDRTRLKPLLDQRRRFELIAWSTEDHSVRVRLRARFDPANPEGVDHEDADRPAHSANTAWGTSDSQLTAEFELTLHRSESSRAEDSANCGIRLIATARSLPPDTRLELPAWSKLHSLWVEASRDLASRSFKTIDLEGGASRLAVGESSALNLFEWTSPRSVPAAPAVISTNDRIDVVPGFKGERLPLDASIMPTAMTWLRDGRLAFTSLRGDVWLAKDSNGDALPDDLQQFATGLAAPYGIMDGSHGDELSLLVSHKPEVLRLTDADANGVAEHFAVVASGWGFTDDYHDWTTGLVRDVDGSLFVGLGSDYSQKNRPADNDRWRGTVLRIAPGGQLEPVAYSFRFPMGLALDSKRRLFVTDNQGVQNTFNEINHVVPGAHYGVPSRHDTTAPAMQESPSLMIPHPWTRSVNALTFLPEDFAVPELAGHGIACEYDTRCLIRFTTQDVDGVMQGACYRFSLPGQPEGGSNFAGPISCGVGPDGAIYVGSLWDSGWQGGQNTGSIERIVPAGEFPNGVQEITAHAAGFDVQFFRAVETRVASDPSRWSIHASTREWSGNYASPDIDQHSLVPTRLQLSDDGRRVSLHADGLKAGYVYELRFRADDPAFWPSEGFYSMKRVPTANR